MRAMMPAPPARHLYSSSPAYAQQAYEQPVRKTAHVHSAPGDDRGLLN
jgi:hypothetical protein